MNYKIVAKYIKSLNFNINKPDIFLNLSKDITKYKFKIDIKSNSFRNNIVEIETTLSLTPKEIVNDKIIASASLSVLAELEKNLNKKVLYCKHPKCDYPKSENFNLIEKNFEVTTFNTEEKLYESFLAIFQSSLLINYAILLKKKIIIIHSDLLGNFYKRRFENYKKEVELFNWDISNEFIFKKDNLLKELNEKIKNYDKYEKNNLFEDRSLTSHEQIDLILDEEFK